MTDDHFSKISGTIHFDPPEVAHLSVEAQIEVGSLTTGHPERDEHLLSADYFDAATYPKMFFKSSKVEPTSRNRCKVRGDLTIRGNTHPAMLEAEFFGPVKSPFSDKVCIGFAGRTKVNREDYGMTWNAPMEGGGVVTSREVQIDFDLEADLSGE